MKKLFLIFISLITINCHSQLSYTYAFNDIKDLIIIQSLLAENRNIELNDFFSENGYVIQNKDSPNHWIKFDQFIDFIEGNSNFFATYIISDDFQRDGYSNNMVTMLFTLKENNDFRQISNNDAAILKNLIYEKLNPGLPYAAFKAFENSENKDISDNVIKIDERTIKFYNDKLSKYETYICSNFTSIMSPSINKGVSFFGPSSKVAWIEFGFNTLESQSGKLIVQFFSIASFGSESFKSKELFDVEQFKSLTDLNQIIWSKIK